MDTEDLAELLLVIKFLRDVVDFEELAELDRLEKSLKNLLAKG